MSIRINGTDLDNPARKWTLARGSTPVSELEFVSGSLDLPGRDGTMVFPTRRRPVTLSLVVKAPLNDRSELLALMTAPTLLVTDVERPGFRASGRLISSRVDQVHWAKGWTKDEFIVEIPEGCWRSSSVITFDKYPYVASNIDVFPGISAPVQDAQIKIVGPMSNPEIVDSSGSWFSVGMDIPSGSAVRFDSATGRSWVTSELAWSGGVEATPETDFGGPRGFFEITPNFSVPGRVGRLTLLKTSASGGAGVVVRGRNAKLF